MTVMLSAEIGYANTILDEAFGRHCKAGFTAAFRFSGTCAGKDAKKEKKRILV